MGWGWGGGGDGRRNARLLACTCAWGHWHASRSPAVPQAGGGRAQVQQHTCLVVLMTRMELEHVSEIALQQKPMAALRARNMGRFVLRS